jgi:hypothetical protein
VAARTAVEVLHGQHAVTGSGRAQEARGPKGTTVQAAFRWGDAEVRVRSLSSGGPRKNFGSNDEPVCCRALWALSVQRATGGSKSSSPTTTTQRGARPVRVALRRCTSPSGCRAGAARAEPAQRGRGPWRQPRPESMLAPAAAGGGGSDLGPTLRSRRYHQVRNDQHPSDFPDSRGPGERPQLHGKERSTVRVRQRASSQRLPAPPSAGSFRSGAVLATHADRPVGSRSGPGGRPCRR